MLQSLRLLVGAMMSALVLIGVVLTFAAPHGDRFDAPPWWLVVGQVVAGAAVHLLLGVVGSRVPALPPGQDEASAQQQARAALMAVTVLRFALAESVALLSVAAMFVLDPQTVLSYLLGAAVSLLLLAWHAYPSTRSLERTVGALEREGGRSHLRDELGLSAGGAVQRL